MTPAAPATPTNPAVAVALEPALGVADRGIWSDLDAQVRLALPAGITPERVSGRIDTHHAVLVVAVDGFPRKVYPLGGPAEIGRAHV